MPKKQKLPSEIEILKSQLARALADYDNLQKRTNEEKITWISRATQRLVQNLLPVVDTFEAAQEHLKDSGLAIAINQFKEVLKSEGLEEIRPKVGDNFDENLMEAVEVVNGKEDGKVAEVLNSGWKFIDLSAQAGGMVIRHARTKVFKAEKAS